MKKLIRAFIDASVLFSACYSSTGASIYTALKDAPIVAGAIKAQVDYLVSLDRRHLVDVPEVTRGSGLKIVLPAQLLAIVKQADEKRGASESVYVNRR